MSYGSLSDLLSDVRSCIDISGGAVKVTDAAQLRDSVIDKLVYAAVFGSDEVKDAARWIIWQSAWEMGVQPASIDGLYQARARGEYGSATVPAVNVRAMAWDVSRALVRAAHSKNVGPFIFELAKSEMGYTHQTPAEYATVVTAASIKEGHQGPIFIQGDHFQASAKNYGKDPDGEIEGLRKLIREAVSAGFLNIDIDTSTLVDLSFPTLDEQQRHNYERCAELAKVVRDSEPAGVTISTGGEIGEVGKKNSTPDELNAYADGFERVFSELTGRARGLSKISVQTGTSHGGVVLPDGSIAQVKLDFDTLKLLSSAARTKGMGGAVQHGASTLPEAAFDKFPQMDTLEVHLATEFQNILFDGGAFPEELKQDIYKYLREACADEVVEGETDEQFIYKTRKKAWGPFKQQTWYLDADTRTKMGGMVQNKFEFLMDKLGVANTVHLTAAHIKPVKVDKPMPEALQAAAK
jgi:fructose-bisphosphate aldolase, class II